MPWLERCLNSIDHDRYKTVVVDNASKDLTITVIKSQYPHVILFEERDNLGFGQGNNKGISYALNNGAEHVFLLNQDAYLVDDCLESLISLQQKKQEYGILSPIHVNKEVDRIDAKFLSFIHRDKQACQFLSDAVLDSEIKEVYDAPFLNAAGWLLSRECLMKVGGFDPIFFHYGEDRNYCQRVLYHGFAIGFVPDTFMIHDREDRPDPKVKKFSQIYYDRKERLMKVQYADLNLALDKTLSKLQDDQKKLDKKILKSKLKFQTETVKNLQRTKSLYRDVQIQIKDSVNKNLDQGPHYLGLSNSNQL